MKKSVLIGITVVAVGVVLWIGLRGSDLLATKSTKNHERKFSESSVSASGAGGLNEAVQCVDNQKQVYAEDKLSDAVKALLGLDGEEHNYNSLVGAIAKLSKDLSADDVAALREMLTWPSDRFPEGMRPIEINAVKNDVLDKLLRQTALPEGIGMQLVEMASNPDNDPVWRDYCVQFMTPYYERASAESMAHVAGSAGGATAPSTTDSEAAVPPNSELQAVREAMLSALDERGGTIAGTSLIGLELLSRSHDEFDREAIVSKASEIAADETASSASRLTALRLSAGIGTAENAEYAENTAETARVLAQTGETVLLRSAAIVTLGEVGTEEDRELLESFALSDNQQIAAAAKLALQKMDAPKESAVDLTKTEMVSETTPPSQPAEKLPPVLIN